MRSPTVLIGLVRRPSQIASAWMPGTPNATSAPERLEALRDQAPAGTRFDRLPHSSDPIQAHAARSSPRHPLRAGPDRAEDAAEPLLPGAALHRLREREAGLARALPRHEGRGRLGGRLHRGRAGRAGLRLLAGRLAARLGRRRRRATSPSWPTRRTSTARSPASSSRTAACTASTRESRWPAIAPSQLASDYYASVVPKAMELEDIRRVRGDWVRAAKLVARRGLRHRLRLRRAQLPAAAVSLAVLQQAHRLLRRLAREPRPLLAGDARGRARGGRRRLRDRRPLLRRGALARRRRARRGARVRPPRRPPRRSLGRERRLDRRVVEGLRAVALLQGGLPARVDRPRARGDGEADRRRRATHEPRPHGRDRPLAAPGT